MKYLIFPLFLLLNAAAAAENSRDYIREFYDARSIEQSDPQGAFDGMMRCFRKAVRDGNGEYAAVGGLNACMIIYEQGKVVETGKLAREIIIALHPLTPGGENNDAIRRVQFFGYMERGYMAEGKLGEAMRCNRAGAEAIRGKMVSADADGVSLSVAEIPSLPTDIRGSGWRLIEREAHLLDLAGKTVQGLELLNQAAAALEKNDHYKMRMHEHFYALKLLSTRILMMDFLGYDLEAIQASEKILANNVSEPSLVGAHMHLRINLIKNLSQWHGPSEDYLEQARALGKAIRSKSQHSNIERHIASMEFALKQSRDVVETLRENRKKYQDLGDDFEASFAERDSLIARSKLGEKGLEPEFHKLLITLRKHANKRAEPSLYRRFGSYLLHQKRPAEAIPLLAESLRLTRSFGWILHEPAILGELFDARFESGDIAGARATLAELAAYIATNPQIPTARRVDAEIIRANALISLGDAEGAAAVFAKARELAIDLPDFQKKLLTPESVNRALASISAPPLAVASEAPQLHIQPREIVSIARPDTEAKTRFTVFNPSNQNVRGRWIVSGPGASIAASSVRFSAGGNASTVSQAANIAAGGQAILQATIVSAKGIAQGTAQIAWQTDGQDAAPSADSVAKWHTQWDSSAASSVILDASHVQANPYRSVSLFHELAVPLGDVKSLAFRLRSPSPLRLEYYSSATGELVAIDANGNGNFTDEGDLHIRSNDAVCTAIFPTRPAEISLSVEVRIYSMDGLPLMPSGTSKVLTAEVYRDGTWHKEAENILR